ncbi:MAG: response regulator transcription factor [Chloroflexota bacterium]
MRVLVVDDHSLFRDGIVSLLEAGGYEVVGQGSNGLEAIDQALQLEPDLVLLDIHMPVMTGLTALKQIKAKRPNMNVVMLTVSEEDKDIIEAIRAGANGYLLKQINSTEFFQLLERLQRGEAAISPPVATRLFKHLGPSEAKGRHVALSDREIEVLRLVADGKPNREIALALSVSDNTVKFHLKNILQKLNVANRAEAVMAATQMGIL